MSGVPSSEAGDGHEHGCLDALAMTLSSSSEFEHLNFQLVIKHLKEAGLHSAEDLALAGCGGTLPETVIGQLLPVNADESSRKALNVIVNVGRQALPCSTRLCLRQLRNEQGKPEVQTCTANSPLLCPFGFIQHVGQASFSCAGSIVSCGCKQRETGFHHSSSFGFQLSVQKVV